MFANVLVEIKSKKVDKTFTYKIPDKLINEVCVGSLVTIPFGKRELEGYVLKILDSCDIEDIKEIKGLKKNEIVLNEEMIELGYFLQEKTLCSLSCSIQSMLPKALKAKKGVNIKKKYISYLIRTKKDEHLSKPNQIAILNLFENNKEVKLKDAEEISASGVKTLIKNGYLEIIKKEVNRFNLKESMYNNEKTLTIEQENALKKIRQFYNKKTTILLHGVTGSGKTLVYIEAIKDVLKNNKTALVLVPEISLTPQLIDRFNSYFKGSIAVLHSHLSEGEKYDEWRKINEGKVSIVIGARSAIFAPLKNIGLIILDEAHSLSYKQENNPKYHALDIAKKRSEMWNCPVILGSATPDLNSMSRALKKVYEYIYMGKRAQNAKLPNITIVDMANEAKCSHTILSRDLEYKIIERLNNHEQVILLLNRRGHSTYISCSNCGYVYKCPNCDITLTYHKTKNTLRCHYCGYTKFFNTKKCPKCLENSLNYLGLGTEKLEEYLEEVFPTAKIKRMDTDTTKNKGDYDEVINEFAEFKYDILVGTQMVSKGLDFPKVTLVGIINADASLNIPDYKSNEQSFSLLSQASGRAGRNSSSGEVIIQSYMPLHPILNFVKNNDYKSFFNYEMKLRKTLKYPPYYFLIQIKLKSRDYEYLVKEITKVKKYLERNCDKKTIILGPATSSPFIVNKVYSFEILIKYRYDEKIKECLKDLDVLYQTDSKVTLDIDLSY